MAVTKIYKGNIVRDDIVKIYKGNELIYEAVPQGETWLINDDAFQESRGINQTYTALFNSNSETFNNIFINNNPMSGGMFYDSTKVVDPDNSRTFINQAYRTVTFETSPTGDLLAWLQANAVKQ